MIQVEDNLAQTRKEYDMLRIEFEQAMAANDQNCKIYIFSFKDQKDIILFKNLFP